ncbi:MAG: MBL fold metallo-hydrolase [Ktedonobacteraceae bacterium]|nr:MBL fold metallo-hydrolase [Ktedonobacteraceae bacterium]
MKIRTYGDHLIQLTRLGMINCYFVREDDGFTLVDTGMAGSARQILAAAQQLGQPIVRILLTHAHVDHVGSLDALHELLPEAEVLITARDARFLTGDHSLDADEPQVELRGGYPICKTQPARRLQDGDRVGSLEVIATPGHTPGHAAFLDTRDSTIIAGDAFQTLGGVAVSGTFKPLFPLPALATWHKQTALESARRLRTLSPERLAVGHGRVLVDPLAAMDHAIAVMEKELKQQKQQHAA